MKTHDFEQVKGTKPMMAQSSGEKDGPRGDCCHMQLPSPSGHDIMRGAHPARSKKMSMTGGYMVTSPAPTPRMSKHDQ